MSGFPHHAHRAALLAVALAAVAGACGGGARATDMPAPPRPSEARAGESEKSGANTVQGSEMRQSGPQRIEEYLNGRVPGLQVLRDENGRYSLRIRGTASFGKSDEEPLIVVDGIPMAQGSNAEVLRNMDPRDIQRIEVLKDASQTAMYGSRGANGVLLIRTRRN